MVVFIIVNAIQFYTCLTQTSLNLSELESAHNRTCFDRDQSTIPVGSEGEMGVVGGKKS